MFQPNQFQPGVRFKTSSAGLEGEVFMVMEKILNTGPINPLMGDEWIRNSLMGDEWIWAKDKFEYQYIFHIDEITEIV